MQSMSARDAKNSFGKLIDLARAEPVAIEKHGRAVVVVLSVEAYERLHTLTAQSTNLPLDGKADELPTSGRGEHDSRK